MNKRQTDRMTSYNSLKIALESPAHKPIWSALDAFEEGVTQWYGSMNVLAALGRTQGTSTKGITVDKDRLAKSIINRTVVIGGAVAAYAASTGDATLAAKVRFSRTDLVEVRDAVLGDEAQNVHDVAASVVAADAAATGKF